ncbi:unnamed protein product, partial [Sphacelaria rigidula]
MPVASTLRTHRGISSEAADTSSIGRTDEVKRPSRVNDDAGTWGLKTVVLARGGCEEEGGGEIMAGAVEAPLLEPPRAGSVRHAYSPVSGPAWKAVAMFLGWREQRARDLITF